MGPIVVPGHADEGRPIRVDSAYSRCMLRAAASAALRRLTESLP